MDRIDTAKVKDRRELHFASLDQLWADVERIAAADRAGRLRRTGNWTAGQAFGHLAAWINFGFDGNPLTPPWFVKFIVGWVIGKNRFLRGPMRVGVHIPRVPGGTVATELLSLDEGLSRLQKAVQRLRASAPTQPNTLFGPLTHGEWIQLSCRHAELHLSFFHP
jgi:hypothetical protein